ncbi:MAG: hypothetical protein SGJ19_03285 [Planctomycetia bacterium]|nr:hypothetical protein [Planctomycetia bacterium]
MPDSATGVRAPAAEPSAPPIDLEKLFQDEDTPPTNEAPVETEPGDIPPPFDSKKSGASKKRDPNRTLSALSAGLKAKTAPVAQAKAPRDPWQAAPVRNVNGEKTTIGGPVLNEPNLMPEPADGPALQATPSSAGEAFEDRSTSQLTADSAVSQVANWTETAAEPAGSEAATGGNPLRSSSSGAGSRRSNPLRRN